MKKINRWYLSEEMKVQYKPIIRKYLEKISKLTQEQIGIMSIDEYNEYAIDFTDTLLSPYHIWKTIENLNEFEYMESDISDNGWEQDFWIYFESLKDYPKLVLTCCGMTRECILSLDED